MRTLRDGVWQSENADQEFTRGRGGAGRETLKVTPGNGVASAKPLELPLLMSSDTSLFQVRSGLFFFDHGNCVGRQSPIKLPNPHEFIIGSIAVTKYRTIYLHLERNWPSTLSDHRAFVYSTSPLAVFSFKTFTAACIPSVQQAELPASLSSLWTLVLDELVAFPHGPLLHHLGNGRSKLIHGFRAIPVSGTIYS